MIVKLMIVNAFSETVNGGNPAGVVLNSPELTDDQMKFICKEINVSETAFVCPSRVADYNVRFFSPEIEVDLWSSSYIFNKGHKIRLAISSSNYPRFSVNKNNGDPLYNESGDAIVANNVIYHDEEHPSHLTLPVVSLDSIYVDPEDNTNTSSISSSNANSSLSSSNASDTSLILKEISLTLVLIVIIFKRIKVRRRSEK